MAIAKFTIEMAADLGQLRRDVQSIEQVVSQMGAKVAKGYTPAAAGLDALGAAHTKVADASRLSAIAQQKASRQSQYQNLQTANQLQDFAIQVAGGQNPLLAAVQQGSQLSAVYGGFGNAVRGVTALITPMAVGITAGVAAAGGLAYAFIEGAKQSAEFNRSIAITGNAAGMTASRFDAMVSSISKSADIGSGKAREVAQALVSTGRFGPQGFEDLAKAAAQMSKATGKTADEVAQEFARMADAPGQYAVAMNKSMNFLTDKQLQHIQVLEATGRRQEAVQQVQIALAGRMGTVLPQNLGYVERALSSTKKGWDNFWDAAFGLGRTDTIDEKIKSLQERIRAAAVVERRTGNSTPALDQDQAKLADLLEQRRTERKAADAKAEQASAETAKTEQRQLAERLLGARLSLKSAEKELSLKPAILAADAEISRLEVSRAVAFTTVEQGLIAEAVAKQQLLKLDQQSAKVQADMALARASVIATSPETGIAAEQKVAQLKGQQLEIDAKRADIQRQLGGEKAKLAEADRVELQSWNEQLRSMKLVGQEYTFQQSLIGKTAIDAQRLTDVRQIENTILAKQIEMYRDRSLTEEQQLKRSNQIYQERADQLEAYAKLHSERYQQIYSEERGVSDAVQEYINRVAQAGSSAKDATGTIIRTMEDGITKFVTTGKLGIKDFANTVIAEFIRIKIAQPLAAGASGYLGNLFGGGGGSGAVNTGTVTGADLSVAYAKGGAFSGGIQAFAKGGAFTNSVVTSPTPFKFANGGKFGLMGEAGPEAVMPLQRDSKGRLGVIAAMGGGGAAPSVQVNVINQGGPLEVQSQKNRPDGNGGFTIDVMVRQLQDAMADNVANGSGTLYRAIGSRFQRTGAA